MIPYYPTQRIDMGGSPYISWDDGGQTYYVPESMVIDALRSGTVTPPPSPPPSSSSTQRSGPSPEELVKELEELLAEQTSISRGIAAVQYEEMRRAMDRPLTWVVEDKCGAWHQEKESDSRHYCKMTGREKREKWSLFFRYTPPEEALRAWRYDISASGHYGERRVKLDEAGGMAFARTEGADVNATFRYDRWLFVGGFSLETTEYPGLLKSVDHEVLGLNALAIYRVLVDAVEGIDVQLLGSLEGSRVRYEHDIPEIARDTTYVMPGLGIAAGGGFTSLGNLRGVYYLNSSIALGSGRRQITGDREIRVHTGGLLYDATIHAEGRNALRLGLRAIYQHVPDLPEGWDGDSFRVSGSLSYHRDPWAASVSAERTLGDSRTDDPWSVRLALYRNL